MKKLHFKIGLLFCTLLAVLGCAEDFVEPIVIDPEFTLILLNSNENSVQISYSIDTETDNLRLIWSRSETFDITDYEGALALQEMIDDDFTIPDLEQGATYHFKLVAQFDQDFYYSDSIAATIIPQMSIVLDEHNEDSASFSYTAHSSLMNLKVIWNDQEPLDDNNKLGELNLSNNTDSFTLSNLTPETTYFVALVGEFQGSLLYSVSVAVMTDPDLSLSLIEITHNTVNLSHTATPGLQNLRLLWNDNSTVDIDNSIGQANLSQNTGSYLVENLTPESTYHFRLTGEANSQRYYSEVLTLTTEQDPTLLDSRAILTGLNSNTTLFEVLKLSDGYLFVTGGANIVITKTNANFDQLWSFTRDGNQEDLFYAGIYPLPNGNDYLLLFNGFGASNSDPYGNSYTGDQRAYVLKFTGSGQQKWLREYSTNVNDNYYVRSDDFILRLSKYSQDSKFLVQSDNTYYTDNDEYQRTLTFDSDGNVTGETSSSISSFVPRKVSFKQNGDWLNYGTVNESIRIEKYNSSNQLLYQYTYGMPGDNIRVFGALEEQSNVSFFAVKQYYSFHQSGDERWILTNNEGSGQVVSEFLETEDNTKFRPKDLIKDQDGSYLALFFDMFNVRYEGGNCCVSTHDYNYATLIKLDPTGNVIWKYRDGTPENTEYFEPERVFQDGDDYILIGTLRYQGLWMKRIHID